MVTTSPWAPGPRQYAQRVRATSSRSSVGVRTTASQFQREDTGITWSEFDVSQIQPSDVTRARARFQRQLPELIWNTAALEGNNFTLPEVRTLLDGATVGGKRTDDEQQILALSEAYNRLDALVGSGRFELSKTISDELHGLVARHEAIESGHFRGEGHATGGGAVSLASGGSVPGVEHGEGGVLLRQHFDDLNAYLATVDDHRERALLYFASVTRRQLYFDGNKRTARLMMAGELMANGFDVVSVPFARKLEFNVALDTLFTTDDATDLLNFLGTCSVPDA